MRVGSGRWEIDARRFSSKVFLKARTIPCHHSFTSRPKFGKNRFAIIINPQSSKDKGIETKKKRKSWLLYAKLLIDCPCSSARYIFQKLGKSEMRRSQGFLDFPTVVNDTAFDLYLLKNLTNDYIKILILYF